MEEPGFSDLLIVVGVAFLARGVGGHHGDRGKRPARALGIGARQRPAEGRGGRTWNDLNRGLVTHQFLDAAIGHGRALGSTSSSGIIASAELTSGEWHQTEGETLEQRKVHADPHRDGLFYVLHRAVGRRRVPGDIVVDWGSFQPYSIAVDPSPEATVLVGTADRIMRLRSADYSG
ncbi:MAG: hypothetical protein M3550_04230, partial [Actinomycetota bacterium]|nr:hypothetical protein [Actinomycetota bacterium]